MSATLAIIAKAPIAGRSKTRLCPPLTGLQAAVLAEAALRDTLAAVLATPAGRRVLVLDGPEGPWLPAGLEVIPQRGKGLADRLAAAFDDIGGPTLLVGMDTPQVMPALLSEGLTALTDGAASVLGLAPDGGYWAVGMAQPNRSVFCGVPMSSAQTGQLQLQRLMETYGRSPAMLAPLRDVDLIADAHAVAAGAPFTNFAAALRDIEASSAVAA